MELEYNEYGCLIIPEILVSCCIVHPYILRCNKIVRDKGKLILNYNTNGLYLKTLNEELTVKQKMRVIYQIGKVIAMLHSKGYCHRRISLDNVIGEYDNIYFYPRLLTQAVRCNREAMIADTEDYKMLILDLLCPDLKESYTVSKSDLSVILPYVPKSLKDFITRLCNHDKIFEVLSSPEFDHIRDNITEYKMIKVDRYSEYGDRYRDGLKEIYCVYKDFLGSRYVDELYASIDIYNRAYPLVEKGMSLSTYYCACILISSKIFGEEKLKIDTIRNAIHELIKSHPRREDVLSAELDIIVYLNGVIYTPYICEECKNIREVYAMFIFYIIDKELYKTYHTLYDKLKKKHINEGTMRSDCYITCKELFMLEEKLTEEEQELLENYII